MAGGADVQQRPLIRRFFLHPGDPADLAWTRLVVFSLVAWRLDATQLRAMATLPPDVLAPPVGMGWALAWLPIDADVAGVLVPVTRGLAVLAALGMATRLTTVAATIGIGICVGGGMVHGFVSHDRHFWVWAAALLAASPCGDAWSLDDWWRGRSDGRPHIGAAVRYGFPRRCLFVLAGLVYFFPGFWKLAVGGVDWVFSENLQHLDAKVEWIRNQRTSAPWPAWLYRLGGLYTVVLEIGFLPAIFSRAGRVVAPMAAVLFHLGTRTAIGIGFENLWYGYAMFLPVGSLVRRWSSSTRAPAESGGDDRPPPLAVAAAVVLIAGNVAFGLARIDDGFPWTCFPTFENVHTSIMTSFVVEGTLRDGRVVTRSDARLGEPGMGTIVLHALRGSQRHHPSAEGVEGREARWRAMCTFIWQHNPALRDARELSFFLQDVDVARRSGTEMLLERRHSFECDAPEPDVAR